MKKFLMLFSLCAIFLIGGVTLAACGENLAPETYNITLPISTDYTVECDKNSAEAGQEITLNIILLNNEMVIKNVLADEIVCEKNYDGTFSFIMPAKDVEITVETAELQEVLSADFVWFDDNNIYTITMAGDGTLNSDTRNLNITFADKQAMTNVKSSFTSSNQDVIPNEAIEFVPVRDSDLNGSSGSNVIVKGIIEIDPFQINTGTSYLTMEFANGNSSFGASNKGVLIIKISVVPYGDLTLETVKETLVIDLFSELQYRTGDKFCLRIGDRDYVDGSSNAIYTDFILTMESSRKLTVEFDYIIGHKFWIRLVEGEVQPDIQPGYVEEFIFDGGTVEGDEEGVYTGYYNNSLMYMEADDRVTIDAQKNPALEN